VNSGRRRPFNSNERGGGGKGPTIKLDVPSRKMIMAYAASVAVGEVFQENLRLIAAGERAFAKAIWWRRRLPRIRDWPRVEAGKMRCS